MSFLGEIKRRKIFQVAAVYAVVAWLLIQVADVVLPAFSAPDWILQVVIFLLLLGFPVAVVLSWAFDLTPAGVVRDDGKRLPTHSAGHRLEFVLAGLLLVAITWIGFRELNPPVSNTNALLPNSVAVLPFENLSPDADNAYFAAGIHDTVLHELAKIQGVNVIARTSVLPYADGQTPIAVIAARLNVETVMEGTVQYAEDQVRITVQLVDPLTGSHLWSGNYDRDFADVFEIQSEIAERIAMALEAELLPEDQQRLEQRPTESDTAYALYLRARALVPNIGPYLPAEFFTSLNRAVDLDPSFALAHATLAFAYALNIGNWTGDLSMADSEALAREHAGRALTLDNDQGLAYAALAFIDQLYLRFPESQANWNKALDVSRGDEDVLDDGTAFFAVTGQPDRARLLAARKLELNPLDIYADAWLGFGSGNFDSSTANLRENISRNPSVGASGMAQFFLSLYESVRGNYAAARDALELSEELGGTSVGPIWEPVTIYLLGRMGQADAARQRFESFVESADSGNYLDAIPATHWVLASLGIGDEAEALRWLQIVADSPGPYANFIMLANVARNSFADPVLDQPEFAEVRRAIGFPD
jgi:TolB-like protein/Tfp pilus assembly protein PilF